MTIKDVAATPAGLRLRRHPREVPVLRVVVERTPELKMYDGCRLTTAHDAAAVLAPFLRQAPPTQRVALALLDARQALIGIALFDGPPWRACCLRAPDIVAPAVLTGAAGFYIAHRHPGARLWMHCGDTDSLATLRHTSRKLKLVVCDSLLFGERGACTTIDESHASWDHYHFKNRDDRLALPTPSPPPRRAGAVPRASTTWARKVAARAQIVTVAGGGRRASVFTLCGQHVRLERDETPLRVACAPIVRTYADVTPLLMPLAQAEQDPRALWLGLVDPRRRLYGVVRLRADRAGCPCETITSKDVYRAALACGAYALFVAHRHDQPMAQAVEEHRRWTTEACAWGGALGRELRDHVIFGPGGSVMSLRERRGAGDGWREGVGLADVPFGWRVQQAGHQRPRSPSRDATHGPPPARRAGRPRSAS